MRNIYIPFLIVMLLSACQGSKHYTKLATKQEVAGLTSEAANNYYVALAKNRNNLDAQIGMKKTGQLVLNGLLNDFSRAKNFGSPKDAVYSFHTARDYRDKIKTVGIELLLAEFYLTDYEAAKSAYLLQLYDEGTTLLEEQRFKEAENRFNEIRSIEPNYKDSGELADMAYMEPLYSKGVEEMQQEHYRAAYDNFQQVITKKSTYKDTKDLVKKCIEKGRYTIALLPFENGTTTTGLDVKVSAYALEALTSIDDPFLRVVDRDHMQAILQEQKLQLSGVVDDATAVRVGELVGANAILTGTVLNYDSKSGSLRSKSREAYESYSVKKLNPVDGKYYYETRYRPATYTEYYNSASSTVSFQYKLIALETGEIMKTEILEKTMSDEVLYGRYDGDVNNLFPMVQGGVGTNSQDRRALTSLFSARQELKSTSELSNNLFNTVASQMSKQIGSQVREIVK